MCKENKGKKDARIRRADLLLAVMICAAALGLFAARRIGQKECDTLVISWEGAEVERLSLAAEQKNRIRYCQMLYTEGGIFFRWYEEGEAAPKIPEGTGYNLLAISGTEVSMLAADCRDQICVHHIPISSSGESIICLPNKLVVEIQGGEKEERLDGMVK